MVTYQTALPQPVMMQQSVAPKATALPAPPESKSSSSATTSDSPARAEEDERGSKPASNAGPAKAKLLLEVHDLRNEGARSFLQAIDHGFAVEEYMRVVLHLLYGPISGAGAGAGGAGGSSATSEMPGTSPASKMPGTRSVTLVVRSFNGIAHTTSKDIDDDHKEIHLSTDYLSKPDRDKRDLEIRGVLVHEMVHCFQWNGCGACPGGLCEGVADWVRLNCGLAPSHWKRSAECDWDAGYEKTAYFLDYLEERFGYGTVRRLNACLCEPYDEGAFWWRLFGKSVHTLWKEYAAWLKRLRADDPERKPCDDGDNKPDDPEEKKASDDRPHDPEKKKLFHEQPYDSERKPFHDKQRVSLDQGSEDSEARRPSKTAFDGARPSEEC